MEHLCITAQPKNSLVQLVCPKAAMAPVAKKFLPTDDATVKAGSASGTNFGAAKTLQVRLSPSSDQGSTAAALLKFNLAGVNPAKVRVFSPCPYLAMPSIFDAGPSTSISNADHRRSFR